MQSLATGADVGTGRSAGNWLLDLVGGPRPARDRLAEPMGVAVSDDGARVYVADHAQDTVFVFDLAKGRVRRLGPEPIGRPLGVAVDGKVLDASGKPASLYEVLGDKLVLMGFIYTHCPDVNGCPLASYVMKQVQAKLLEDPALAGQVRHEERNRHADQDNQPEGGEYDLDAPRLVLELA